MEVVIRRAAALDAVAVVKLLKKGYADRWLPFQEPDDGLAVTIVLNTILRGFTLVAEKDKRIVGIYMSVVQPEDWAITPFIDNAFFYVIPQERRRGTAEKLLQLVHEQADARGMWCKAGTFIGDENEELTLEFFRKQGYQPIGVVMAREPVKRDEQAKDHANDDESK